MAEVAAPLASGSAQAAHRTAQRPQQLRRSRRRKQTTMRWIVFVVVVGFLVIPLLSMAYFSSRFPLSGKWTGHSWSEVIHLPQLAADNPASYGPLWEGMKNSAVLVVLTLAIMLVLLIPTMTWVKLRVPRLYRWMEFISLLPLSIPAIVLVVGLGPVYRVVSEILSTNAIWLCFIYVIWVLPFAFRALDAGLGAIDLATLSEAARSLGASWGRVMWQIVLPNIRSAVVSASFISIALVLGEFTFAELLNRTNLQTGIFLVSQTDGQLAVTLSLAALILVFVLLMVLTLFTDEKRNRKGAAA